MRLTCYISLSYIFTKFNPSVVGVLLLFFAFLCLFLLGRGGECGNFFSLGGAETIRVGDFFRGLSRKVFG